MSLLGYIIPLAPRSRCTLPSCCPSSSAWLCPGPHGCAAGGGGGDDEDGGLAGLTNKQKKNKAKNEKRLELKKQRGKEAAHGGRKKANRLMEVGSCGAAAGQLWGSSLPRYPCWSRWRRHCHW